MNWTDEDVEAVAQATMRELIPPLNIMHRLGPNPPREYLMALGRRVWDLQNEEVISHE